MILINIREVATIDHYTMNPIALEKKGGGQINERTKIKQTNILYKMQWFLYSEIAIIFCLKGRNNFCLLKWRKKINLCIYILYIDPE